MRKTGFSSNNRPKQAEIKSGRHHAQNYNSFSHIQLRYMLAIPVLEKCPENNNIGYLFVREQT